MSATVQPKEQASVEQLESRIVQVVSHPSKDPRQLLLLFSQPVFYSLSALNKHSEELAIVEFQLWLCWRCHVTVVPRGYCGFGTCRCI